LLLSILLSISNGSPDIISLKDGMSAKAEILDTTGCSVKFRRNGNVIEIAKDNISHLIINSDTVSYKSFVCTPEIQNQSSGKVFEDGYSVDKVNSIINSLEVVKSDIRQCRIYYLTELVNGKEFESCWNDKFKLFEEHLCKKYPNTKAITKDELFKLLKSKEDTNCVLIPFQGKFGYMDGKHIIGDIDMNDMVANNNNASGAIAKVEVNIKIVDLLYREIVFDEISEYHESVFNIIKVTKEEIGKAREKALENALLNSIDKTRKFISKSFLEIQ
jgi:hypothetical protein